MNQRFSLRLLFLVLICVCAEDCGPHHRVVQGGKCELCPSIFQFSPGSNSTECYNCDNLPTPEGLDDQLKAWSDLCKTNCYNEYNLAPAQYLKDDNYEIGCACKIGFVQTADSRNCEACPAGKSDWVTAEDRANRANSTACLDCLNAKYSASSGSECITCDKIGPGAYASRGSTSCEACPLGKSLSIGQGGALLCISCSPGFYVDDPNGKLQCDSCPKGKYTNSTASTFCRDCNLPVSADFSCTCLSGYEIKGTSECSPCQSGFFSNDGTVCYACGAAEYSDKTASTHCEYCYQPNENRSACVLKSKPEEEKDAHEPISFLAWFLPLVFSMIIISVATVYYLRRKKKRYESIRYQVINSEDTEN